MEVVQESAYAKLNLGLDVLGRREDGYHLVRMVMQQVDIHDEISIYKTVDPDISLEADFGGVHLAEPMTMGDGNLCVIAARAMGGRIGVHHGYFIHLAKRIPIAAGMAGGSSDAAAVLRAINRLEGSPLSAEELKEIALGIGADVPYCVEGGTRLAEGIGEKLTELAFPGEWPVLVAKPPEGASTGEIYRAYDSEEDPERPDIDALIEALKGGDRNRICECFGNALEPVTKRMLPQILRIEDMMKARGAVRALMTGSGPTVFGIFEDEDSLMRAAAELRGSGLCETVAGTHFIKGGD